VEQTKVETKIAAWRVRRGMTQAEVAAALGMSVATYWRYERGRIYSPGIRQLSAFAFLFGCELDDLIEDEWRPGYLRPGARWTFNPPDLWRT
jgi:transcriptional regulator with XRE-family HTH domain